MLALHYFSNSSGVCAITRQLAAAWWSQFNCEEDDGDPVYSKDLIKEFDTVNPPLESELAWMLSKGREKHLHQVRLAISCQSRWFAKKRFII